VLADRLERRAVVHVVEAHAGGVQLAQALHEVVPHYRHDLELVAVLLDALDQRAAARQRVHPAGVGDDFDAAFHQQRQRGLDLADEVAGVAALGIARPLLLHDRHGDLGEEVESHHVHGAQVDLTPELREIVAPIASGVGDADHVRHVATHASGSRREPQPARRSPGHFHCGTTRPRRTV
jgi:hypothetical protein